MPPTTAVCRIAGMSETSKKAGGLGGIFLLLRVSDALEHWLNNISRD